MLHELNMNITFVCIRVVCVIFCSYFCLSSLFLFGLLGFVISPYFILDLVYSFTIKCCVYDPADV